MLFPDKKTIQELRVQYPKGTRVRLLRMEDVQAPPIGILGTVLDVDDAGSLIMKWDNGSGLSVVYGADLVEKV